MSEPQYDDQGAPAQDVPEADSTANAPEAEPATDAPEADAGPARESDPRGVQDPDLSAAAPTRVEHTGNPVVDSVLDSLEELDRLPRALGDRLRSVLLLRADAQAPESQAFHAADVLDRVLQVHHHARAAAFTADQALDDLDLVHEGPVQAFHLDVLRSAGL